MKSRTPHRFLQVGSLHLTLAMASAAWVPCPALEAMAPHPRASAHAPADGPSRKSGAMAQVPADVYKPAFRSPTDPDQIQVPAFQLDTLPVSNADFLAFVTAQPQWRRSKVKRVFADAGYLSHWAGDLDLGPGSGRAAREPVTHVSWFAAKAYAQWCGKRLPTTAEWELAAAAGFTVRDGSKDPALAQALQQWYTEPAPSELPTLPSHPANVLGIHDLHGVVWEWTSDFNTAMVTGDARGDTGLERNLFCAGGAQSATDRANYPAFMRFALRSSLKAAFTLQNMGFRCASDPAPGSTTASCCKPVRDTASRSLPLTSLYQLPSEWRNDAGARLQLATYRGRPQVIVMFFSHCEYACPALVFSLKQLEASLPATVRETTRFTLVSFDPDRDTAAELHRFRQRHQLDSERWNLLTGQPDDLRELAALLGVNYQRDGRGQFAHSNLITLLDANGTLIHQVAGLNQPMDGIADRLRALKATVVR